MRPLVFHKLCVLGGHVQEEAQKRGRGGRGTKGELDAAGRGGGDGCGTQSEVLIMEWRRAVDIAPGGVEAIELQELLLAMGNRGVWPDMPETVVGREGWSDMQKWLCTAKPLGKETVPYEVAARGDEAAREEEEEWREEAAKSKRAKPMGGWPGGAVPRLKALMTGP